MSIVLVTGGAGYVGSHICKALSAAGHTPVVFDNFSRGHREFVRWGPVVEASITNKDALRAALSDHDISAVVHCAALAYVAESVEKPLEYYQTNVSGTAYVLDAMREAGVNTFVFSSSCTVYGVPDSVPLTESSAVTPISPYGQSKWMVEQMMIECSRAYGLKSVALRYFNAAGADPHGEIGEWHDPETHLIPNVLKAAADSARTVEIFGSDFDTPDGTAVRDYIHVSDLADAHVLALEHAKSREGYDVFNLGTGDGASVQEVVNAVERITGHGVRTVLAPRRQGDPDCLIADSQKAASLLGWTPKLSDLQTIVEHAWAYENSERE